MNPPQFTFRKLLVIVSAAATILSVWLLYAFYHYHGSTRWPTTHGIVGTIALKTSFQKPRMTPYFTPYIAYSYTVDGIPRSGSRIDFAEARRFPKAEALAWLEAHYPVGKKVTVYYDPGNPDQAVLVPGASDLLPIGWVCFSTGALTCVASFTLLIRQKRRFASDRTII